jgi:hypothetical protein
LCGHCGDQSTPRGYLRRTRRDVCAIHGAVFANATPLLLAAEPDAADGERPGAARTKVALPLGDVTIVAPADFSRADARRRWAKLIRLIYEVDPLICPKCGGSDCIGGADGGL